MKKIIGILIFFAYISILPGVKEVYGGDTNGSQPLGHKFFSQNNYFISQGFQAVDTGFLLAGYTYVQSSNGTNPKLYDGIIIKLNPEGAVTWQKVIGSPLGRDQIKSFVEAGDGSIFFIGEKAVDASGREAIYGGRLDKSGKLVWEKTFGFGCGNNIQRTRDGNYIIGSLKDRGGALLKIDITGKLIWEKKINEEIISLKETKDGGVILLGKLPTSRIKLLRFDSTGKQKWERTAGINLRFIDARDVFETEDGGYMIVGRDSYDGSLTEGYICLIKTDSQGLQQWDRTLDDAKTVGNFRIKKVPGGGYIMGFQKEPKIITLQRTDKNGYTLWKKTITSNDSKADNTFYALTRNLDGGYSVFGYMNQNGSFINKCSPDYTAINLQVSKITREAAGCRISLENRGLYPSENLTVFVRETATGKVLGQGNLTQINGLSSGELFIKAVIYKETMVTEHYIVQVPLTKRIMVTENVPYTEKIRVTTKIPYTERVKVAKKIPYVEQVPYKVNVNGKSITKFRAVTKYKTEYVYTSVTRYKTVIKYETVTRYKLVTSYKNVTTYQNVDKVRTVKKQLPIDITVNFD